MLLLDVAASCNITDLADVDVRDIKRTGGRGTCLRMGAVLDICSRNDTRGDYGSFDPIAVGSVAMTTMVFDETDDGMGELTCAECDMTFVLAWQINPSYNQIQHCPFCGDVVVCIVDCEGNEI